MNQNESQPMDEEMDEETSPMSEICQEMKTYVNGGKAMPPQKVQELMSRLEDLGGYMDSGGEEPDAKPKGEGGIAILIKNKGAKMASLIAGIFLIGMAGVAKAENLLTYSSNTAAYTSSPTVAMVIQSTRTGRMDRLDAIHVNTPGTSSKLEVWDANEATVTAKRKIGTYDTTAKAEWIFPYGLEISSNVIFFNQGSPPADVTLTGRRAPGYFP